MLLGEPLEIVCGATNIAAGQRVPVALPGAVLPGDWRIERTEKMGVVSNGMLCSGDELGLTADADGILILPEGTVLGAGLADLYGDTVLDVDVKPNRGDALSIVGLAREVAALTGAPLRFPAWDVPETGPAVEERLSVEVRETDLCPRFVGRWVSDVTIGPSPDWVQMRLQAAGMRPISNVVDVTNYVMLELGRPLHVYDQDKLKGAIDVRWGRQGEKVLLLNGDSHNFKADQPLVPGTGVVPTNTCASTTVCDLSLIHKTPAVKRRRYSTWRRGSPACNGPRSRTAIRSRPTTRCPKPSSPPTDRTSTSVSSSVSAVCTPSGR